MPCLLCDATAEQHEKIWCAYASRLNLRDAWRMSMRTLELEDGQLTDEEVQEHLFEHHWVQPSPPGKFHRSLALQEALTTFPRHLFWLLRAIYRAKALSERQIYAMFYLQAAPDGLELRERFKQDLRRLVFRSFLYQHWPENRGALAYEDPGPYYFLNRQAIPVVERLEGVTLEFTTYTTSLQQVHEFQLEHDARMLDVVVAMRECLYDRVFPYGDEQMAAMVGIEHWYSPVQLESHLVLPNKEEVNFAPSALLGVRMESQSGNLSTLLPVWLEYDRGTEEPEDVARGITYYAAYYATSEYKQLFPRLAEHQTPGPLICVCESPYRRDEVAEAFGELLGERQVPVYFTDRQTFCHDPYREDILYAAGAERQRYALLERMLHHCDALVAQRVFAGTDRLTDRSAREILGGKSGRRPGAKPAADVGVDLSAWGARPESG